MDIQGSQYHLLRGRSDFARCLDPDSGLSYGQLWADAEDGLPSAEPPRLQLADDLNVLRLHSETPLFRRAGRTVPIPQSARRGADRDSYGNWFWIDADRASIRWRPTGDNAASLWWQVSDQWRDCVELNGPGFLSCAPPPRPGMLLQGLTVTSKHYLLAGYRDPGGAGQPAESGLLVFDLQAGGAPLRMPWPAGSRFDPLDLADLPDGGALILDASNLCYWQLDAQLRVRGRRLMLESLFQPIDSASSTEPAEALTGPPELIGRPLAVPSLLDPIHPVSIEAGPDGGVLILDSDPVRGYSLVHLFDGDQLRWSVSLADAIEVIDPRDPIATLQRYSLLGYDFAYANGPLATGVDQAPLLYIADGEGKQVVAFDLHTDTELDPPLHTLLARTDFLPLRRWDGKALVRAGSEVYYDFADRWVPIEPFGECRFATSAVLRTPIEFNELLAAGPSGEGRVPTPAGSSLDSQVAGCVWHRLLLDAEIPAGTTITVRARASDNPDLLGQARWLDQPMPYQRSDGPELAWYDPWADRRGSQRRLPDHTGSWELLFQQVFGRYLQLELTFAGNGRSTPQVRNLRAWYPRYSYPDHYLPAIYSASDSADRFLDRFLANFEGFYTALEERIEHSHLILDPRTTPAADLDWLACWFGLALDPQWDEARRRFLVGNVDRFYRMRGTVAGLVSTLRVYLGNTLNESVFIVGPTDVGGVRVVERFLTRGVGSALFGDPSAAPLGADDTEHTANTASTGGTENAQATGYQRVAGAAHRFDVLVPVTAGTDTLAMVTKIVESAKPAHTLFDLRAYYDLFIVGQARLGLDTELGDLAAFVPMITGQNQLNTGYLGYPRPFDIPDRLIANRDRLGGLPAL